MRSLGLISVHVQWHLSMTLHLETGTKAGEDDADLLIVVVCWVADWTVRTLFVSCSSSTCLSLSNT